MIRFKSTDTQKVFKEFSKAVNDEKPKKGTLAVLRAMCEMDYGSRFLDMAKDSLENALIQIARGADQQETASFVGNPSMDYVVRQEIGNVAEEIVNQASKIFTAKAKESLFIDSRHVLTWENGKSLKSKLCNDIYEGYRSANYDQIFYYVLDLMMKDMKTDNPLGIKETPESKEFLFRLYSAAQNRAINTSPSDKKDFGGMSNEETWTAAKYLQNGSLNFEKQVFTRETFARFDIPPLGTFDKIAKELIQKQAKKHIDFNAFINGCQAELSRLLHWLAKKDDVFFGRFKDINFFDIASKYIEDLHIREVTVSGFPLKNREGKKISLFILPGEDPEQAVYDRLKHSPQEGDFQIEDVRELKVSSYSIYDYNEFTERTGVCREGNEQKLFDYMKQNYDDYADIRIEENGDWEMLDKDNNVLRSCRYIVKPDNAPALSTSMRM